MKSIKLILSTLLILGFLSACQTTDKLNDQKNSLNAASFYEEGDLKITPISHATSVIKWGSKIIYTDPVGGAEAFEGQPAPDLIVITDIHGDHLNTETLEAIVTPITQLIIPQAVADKLPTKLKGGRAILENGEVENWGEFKIEAIPMYNLPESDDSRHTKGRGNGYVIEKGGKRLYVSGDTAGIPEMRSLKNIDVALVCMNLPYTMDVEEAASAVLDFKPKTVLPYHYRGQDGLSDVAKFKALVNASNPEIEVVQLNWYPETN